MNGCQLQENRLQQQMLRWAQAAWPTLDIPSPVLLQVSPVPLQTLELQANRPLPQLTQAQAQSRL